MVDTIGAIKINVYYRLLRLLPNVYIYILNNNFLNI